MNDLIDLLPPGQYQTPSSTEIRNHEMKSQMKPLLQQVGQLIQHILISHT